MSRYFSLLQKKDFIITRLIHFLTRLLKKLTRLLNYVKLNIDCVYIHFIKIVSLQKPFVYQIQDPILLHLLFNAAYKLLTSMIKIVFIFLRVRIEKLRSARQKNPLAGFDTAACLQYIKGFNEWFRRCAMVQVILDKQPHTWLQL